MKNDNFRVSNLIARNIVKYRENFELFFDNTETVKISINNFKLKYIAGTYNKFNDFGMFFRVYRGKIKKDYFFVFTVIQLFDDDIILKDDLYVENSKFKNIDDEIKNIMNEVIDFMKKSETKTKSNFLEVIECFIEETFKKLSKLKSPEQIKKEEEKTRLIEEKFKKQNDAMMEAAKKNNGVININILKGECDDC